MSLLDDTPEEQEYVEDEFRGTGIDVKFNEKYGGYADDEISPVAVHQCNVCNKIFMSYKGLQQHAVIHTDQKPYICDVCGRGFRFKSNMFEHRTVHTGYTPHLCPFCGKQFRLKGNMKKHMRVHVTNKEELEAAYRPYSSNRRQSLIPENALVIRGSPVPMYTQDRRRGAPKLALGKDPSKWVTMICQNELLPSSPFGEKLARANMRIDGDYTYATMVECMKGLDFEIYYCPYCKCECSGKEECEIHIYEVHGKKAEDMENQTNYCAKCMRLFTSDSMYMQHQSYHSRVQLMLRNHEIELNSPEIDVSEVCYNLLSNQTQPSVETVPDNSKLPEFAVTTEGSKTLTTLKSVFSATSVDSTFSDPGEITLGSTEDELRSDITGNDYHNVVLRHEVIEQNE
ncbi:unnamed protein product [Caenorhabditis sp. 36 PRJEB53466]|nr:unnamed protein product [Caenorhabditis sp. 36 PRJEB53466]